MGLKQLEPTRFSERISSIHSTMVRAPLSSGHVTSVLTSEVVPGVGGQARVLVLPAVVPGGRALPGALRLHLDHQRDPLVFGAW